MAFRRGRTTTRRPTRLQLQLQLPRTALCRTRSEQGSPRQKVSIAAARILLFTDDILSTEKDSKRLSKIIKADGKAQEQSLAKAMKELANMQRSQKQASKVSFTFTRSHHVLTTMPGRNHRPQSARESHQPGTEVAESRAQGAVRARQGRCGNQDR